MKTTLGYLDIEYTLFKNAA